MTSVYRVQGADGRGPWRPGFSHTWIEADAPADRLAETLFDLLTMDQLRALPLTHFYGCACRTLPGLLAWFTVSERATLARFGFYPVRLQADLVLAESPTQIVIGRRRPFTEGATRYRWQ